MTGRARWPRSRRRGRCRRVALDPGIAAAAAGDGALRTRLIATADAVPPALGHFRPTLLAIGAELCRRQPRYFTEGPETLAPLTRREVAAALAVHPSTVGRAVRGVALGWQGWVVPLETFFPAALPGGSAGAARAHLARLIADEPSGAARSDAALARRLSDHGIAVSRRTVAKYRAEMHLPGRHARNRAVRRGGPRAL